MISYFLNSASEASDFCFKFNLKYPSLRRGFFKVINIGNDFNLKDLKNVINLVTNELTYINFNSDDFANSELIEYCHKNNINTGLTLTAKVNSKISKDLFRSTPDSILIENYNQLNSIKDHQIITLVINSDNINILNRTLLLLSRNGARNFILRTNTIDIISSQEEVKTQLLLFKIKASDDVKIYFCPSDKRHLRWSYKTAPHLSGPRYIDIDISNKCTHSCLFCGLYSSELIDLMKKENQNSIPKEISQIMKQEITFENFQKISNMAFNAKNICLGGMGDPLLHKDFLKMAKKLATMNVNFQAFTNFSYLSNEQIEELSMLSSFDNQSINLIVNISAATANTYKAVRPNQSQKDFNEIINKIKYAFELRKKFNRGIKFSLLSVLNSLNYHELLLYPILASEIGAQEFWPKQLEIHSEQMLKYKLNDEQESHLAYLSILLIQLCEFLDIRIEYTDYLQNLRTKHQISLTSDEIQIALKQELLSLGYDIESLKKNSPKLDRQKINIPHEYFSIDEEFTNSQIEDYFKEDDLSSFYNRHSCFIGQDYIRFLVDGSVHSCCVSNIETGNLNSNSFHEIWNSSRVESFREFTKNFPQNQATSRSKEWSFCNSCSHLGFNKKFIYNLNN